MLALILLAMTTPEVSCFVPTRVPDRVHGGVEIVSEGRWRFFPHE
jgi:hypothetical protein